MYISYKNGTKGRQYATVMRSVNVNGISEKTDTIYLGLVLNKDKGIYRNKNRGTFTYDIDTGEFGVPRWEDVPIAEPAGPPRMNLDFGDAYLIDRMLGITGLDGCIDAMGTGGEDTVASLVTFGILNHGLGLCNAEIWYQGSIIRLLRPRAEMASQRISDMLTLMGDEGSHRDFFKAYLPLVTGGESQLVAIDSKGVVNAIDVELTQPSNHNGSVDIELRLIMVVQLGTGMPIFYRVVAGNILDATTLITTIEELGNMGVNTEFAAVDAGYCTLTNMDAMFDARVNFITRLKPNLRVYKDLVAEYAGTLEMSENRVIHNHRMVYVKRVRTKLTERNEGYAYVCLDMERRHNENRSLIGKYERGEISDSELDDAMKATGVFVLVSSYMIGPEQVLSIYYSRECAEQVFDLANGYANLTPLRVHAEDTIRGMMLLTFITTALVRMMQIRLEGTGVPIKTALLALRNQKCRIYDADVIVEEPMSKANIAYEACGVSSPVRLDANSLDVH